MYYCGNKFQAALLQRWNLPIIMCPFCPFVQVLSVNVSIFTLTAIAIDRHRAILSPLRSHVFEIYTTIAYSRFNYEIVFVLYFVRSAIPTKFRAKMVIATIWAIACVLATPMAIALRVQFIEYGESGNFICQKSIEFATQNSFH